MPELEQEIAHLQELQAKHRKNIHRLEGQLAGYGMKRPLDLLNELEFETEQLRQVEERLAELAARAKIARQPRHELPQRPPAKPWWPVNWERVGAIAGVIAVVIALGTWLVPSETPIVTPTSSPTLTPRPCLICYQVRVQMASTEDAEVEVRIGVNGKAPIIVTTRANSVAEICVPCSYAGQPAVLIAEANGYEYRQDVELTAGAFPSVISLPSATPPPTSTPTPTPTPLPSPTSTSTPTSIPTPTPSVVASRTIALQTCHEKEGNKRYVTAMNGEIDRDWKLRAQTTELGIWEKFTLLYLKNAKVAFRTCHGRYVTATGEDRDWVLRAETKDRHGCEEFILIDLGNGKVGFLTCHGRYVTAMGADRDWVLRAETTELLERERFTVIPLR